MVDYHHPQAGSAAPGNGPAAGGFGRMSIPSALWRRKWWPILLALLFAALATGFSMTLSDRYEATAQVLIDQRPLGIPANDVPSNGLNSGSATASIESQARIFTSPDMLRRIIEREGLARDPEYTGAANVLSRLFPATPGDRTERIGEQLSRNLSVRRDERTLVMDIAVTAPTPEKAARLANAFAAAYLDDQATSRGDTNRQTGTALTSRLNGLRERVRQSEDQIVKFKEQKNLVGNGGKPVTEEQLAAVNNQLALAKTRAAEAKTKLDQLDNPRSQAGERGALPEAINSQTLGPLRQQLGEAQRRATSLGLALGPLHPELQAAQTTLRDAQRAFTEEINRVRNAARIDYDRAIGNEKSLQAQVDSLKRDILSSGRDAAQLGSLERGLEVDRAVYEALLATARDEQPQAEPNRARIITTAVPPPDRVGPPRRLIVAGAAMGGFALGLLLALLATITEAGRVRREW